MKSWFTSDQHFGHKNILELGRPEFKDLREMENTIIQNWNSVVSEGDHVYVLGDFSFRNKEETKIIMQRLNGKKFLIIGNHDNKSNSWYYDVGFDAVFKRVMFKAEGKILVLSHKPIKPKKFVRRHERNKVICVHGHLHKGDAQRVMSNSRMHSNVCVELHNYTPINLLSVLENVGKKRANFIKASLFVIKYKFKFDKIINNRYKEK